MLLSSSHSVRCSCFCLPPSPKPPPDVFASLRGAILEVEPPELRLNAAISARNATFARSFAAAFLWARDRPVLGLGPRLVLQRMKGGPHARRRQNPNQISRRRCSLKEYSEASDDQRAIRKECQHSQGQTGRMWERRIIFCLDVNACAVQMWSNCFHR